jgi:signal transduction histidine kinase/CheY-like chemotaxis protein
LRYDIELVGAEPIGVQTGPRRFGMASIVVAIGLALLALGPGWGLGIDLFRRVLPDLPVMLPTTAMAVIVGGMGALTLYRKEPQWMPLLAAGVVVAIVVAASIAPLAFPGLSRGETMPNVSAATSLLLALSLVARVFGPMRLAVAAEIFGLALVTISLVGFLFDTVTLFDDAAYSTMGLHAAVAYLLLFVSLALVEPDRGWMGTVLAPELGSHMARRVLPVVVIAPLTLGLMTAFAVEHDYMTVERRLALLVFMIIASTGVAVVAFAHLTNLSERRGSAAQAAYLRSERRRQEVELGAARAQKVEALGQLVGGVAHDFNNTLSVILGNLELIERDPDSPTRHTYASEAIAASNRAANLTGQLLAYGRRSRLAPTLLRLEDTVAPALDMFRRVCPANIEVSRSYGAPDAIVRVDSDALQQAILNILINARDAMPAGGRIVVSTGLEHLAEAEVAGFGGPEPLPPGEYATLAVRDTGTGMSPDVAARATEPFFTTKQVGEGTGLGLSTVAGFCRQSGGGLRIESAPGQGSVLTLAFPKGDPGAPAPNGNAAHLPEYPVFRRRVLLVDDDEAVTRVMARQLVLDGHDVVVAGDAEEALAALRKRPLPDVVIADIVMPGRMQGHHLAQRINQRYPGLQVLLMSGHDSPARREEIAALVDLPFLQKPISLKTLRAFVGRTLGASNGDRNED